MIRLVRKAARETGIVAGFAGRRLRRSLSGLPPIRDIGGWNRMFYRGCARDLAHEKADLETFDMWMLQRLNDPRLHGQIVFEYGILLNAVTEWNGLNILDIGSGVSSLPNWMASRGARVTALEMEDPWEARGVVRSLIEPLNQAILRPTRSRITLETGSMFAMDFPDNTFDIVSSISVVEHVDTKYPERTWNPYDEQKRLLAVTLDEMIRVAKPGGIVYVTTECADYDRVVSDAWRPYYYFTGGPEFSSLWPVGDVIPLFYDYVRERGCDLVGPLLFDPADLDGDNEFETYRGPFISSFTMLARKRGG